MDKTAVLGDTNLGDEVGDTDDWGEYDDANAFGLDEYGQIAAGQINPMWGAVGASGLGTLTSVAVRQFSDLDKWSELIGFGAGGALSAAMIFMRRTRMAGWTGLLTSLLNHGPRFLEEMLSAKAAAKTESVAPSASAPGTQPPASGWAGVEVQQIPAAFAGQFGIVAPEAVPGAIAGVGQAPHQDLPQLVGSPMGQAQATMTLLGGPTLSDLAGRFGSTHFNKA